MLSRAALWTFLALLIATFLWMAWAPSSKNGSIDATTSSEQPSVETRHRVVLATPARQDQVEATAPDGADTKPTSAPTSARITSEDGTLLLTADESLRGVRFYVDSLGKHGAPGYFEGGWTFDDLHYDLAKPVWTKDEGTVEKYQQLLSTDGCIVALDLTTSDGQEHRVYLLTYLGGQTYIYPPDEKGVLMKDSNGSNGTQGSIGFFSDEFGSGVVSAIYSPGKPWPRAK